MGSLLSARLIDVALWRKYDVGIGHGRDFRVRTNTFAGTFHNTQACLYLHTLAIKLKYGLVAKFFYLRN